MLIEDGTTGQTAIVNKENRLMTAAIIETHEQHHSDFHKSAYMVGNSMVNCNGDNNSVLHFKNTSSTDKVYITRSFASTDSEGVYVSMMKGCTYVSDGTLINPVNLNFGSNLTADVEVYYSDVIQTSGGEGMLGGFIKKGMNEFDFSSSLILDKGDSVSFTVSGTNGSKATVGLRFYFHGNIY